jgi:hypothetical protein
VLLEVHQDVDESVPDRTRCGERAGMEPIVPDRAAATEIAVNGPCQPDGESAHPGGQESAVVRLDDEMDVIVLD